MPMHKVVLSEEEATLERAADELGLSSDALDHDYGLVRLASRTWVVRTSSEDDDGGHADPSIGLL